MKQIDIYAVWKLKLEVWNLKFPSSKFGISVIEVWISKWKILQYGTIYLNVSFGF